jgi:predicted CXXCH cytochrome family protein
MNNPKDLPGEVDNIDDVEDEIFCQKCHKYVETEDWTAIRMSNGTLFYLCFDCHKFHISEADGGWKLSADKIEGLELKSDDYELKFTSDKKLKKE